MRSLSSGLEYGVVCEGNYIEWGMGLNDEGATFDGIYTKRPLGECGRLGSVKKQVVG